MPNPYWEPPDANAVVKNDAHTIAQPRDIGHLLFVWLGIRSTGATGSGSFSGLDRICRLSIRDVVENDDYDNYPAKWIERVS
jgi:hypothetical protein